MIDERDRLILIGDQRRSARNYEIARIWYEHGFWGDNAVTRVQKRAARFSLIDRSFYQELTSA
jgi:hypothetical protein